MALTKKQQAFVKEYLEPTCAGQTDAARKAGFSVKRAKITAYELMRNPEVKREIDRRLLAGKLQRIEGDVTAKRELTPESVIQDLDDIAEMCKTAGAGAWQVATLVKIAELKGKYLKMFTDRVEFAIDDKLIARLEAGRRNAGLQQLAPATVEGETAETEEEEPVEQSEKKGSIQ